MLTILKQLYLLFRKNNNNKPHLIIEHSRYAITEYDNLNLFPRMFSTLFPYGIGGFESPNRLVSTAFQKQVEYYSDLTDCLFRYHKHLCLWQ